jgi:hypothetical protein
MTDDWLARLEFKWESGDFTHGDAGPLFDEVLRLRTALHRIATQEPRQALGKRWVCPWCESYDHDGGHRDDCPWQIAADALGVELPELDGEGLA